MEWKRPDDIPFPTVWGKFKGKPHGDQPPLNYTIQEITEDLIEEAVDHMSRYFLIRENITSTIGLIEDEISKEELREIWRITLKQRVGLVALVEDEDCESGKRIAGINMTLIKDLDLEKSDSDEKFKGKLWKKTLRTLMDLEKDVDIKSLFGTTKYMTAYGLSVAPQYNGDGVGYQLLMARTPFCKALGIDLTITSFTGSASQYLAKKAGFKTIATLDYTTYKHDGKLAYPKLDGSCLLMAKRISTDGD